MSAKYRIAEIILNFEQALNWLLRSITQTVCLHDLLWFFVSSLMPTGAEEEEQEEEEEDKEKEKKKKDPPKKDHEVNKRGVTDM